MLQVIIRRSLQFQLSCAVWWPGESDGTGGQDSGENGQPEHLWRCHYG